MKSSHESSFDQKLKALKTAMHLSGASKTEMRATLAAYADLHEVMRTQSHAIPSPFSFIRFSYSRTFISAALVILLVAASGVGVTYAAGNSLPGEPLYAIKVDVAEPIQGALITSPAAQAEWQNELAERRLTEATTLAAQNNLATSTQEYLQQQVAAHVTASEQDSAELAANGQTDSALSVRSDLEAKLSAHTQLLALLDAHFQQSGDASTTAKIAVLLNNLNQYRSVVSMSRAIAEAQVAGLSASTTASTTIEVALSSSTPAEHARVAFIDSQTRDRHAEEMQLFIQNAVKLGLLPASTTATTTASTTIEIHDNEDDASTTINITLPSVPSIQISTSTDSGN